MANKHWIRIRTHQATKVEEAMRLSKEAVC